MKLPFAIAILSGTLAVAYAEPPAQPSQSVFVNTLMPQPSQLTEQPGSLVITPSFTVAFGHARDARLDGAVSRALDRLKLRTGLLISDVPSDNATSVALTVDVDGPGEAIQSDDENESYSLDVTPSGARLHAATDIGAIHGLETCCSSCSPTARIHPSRRLIHDTPRFRWRGLMIDCGRHFIPSPSSTAPSTAWPPSSSTSSTGTSPKTRASASRARSSRSSPKTAPTASSTRSSR